MRTRRAIAATSRFALFFSDDINGNNRDDESNDYTYY